MTLLQLNYFCAVAKYTNYNQAARELYISQPTLSKAVSALEKELGVPLFERKGKYVELTQYGQQYYEQIAPSLQNISNATSEIKSLSLKNQQHINLAYNPPFAQGFVPDTVSAFLASDQNHNITVQFNQATSTRIIHGLADGSFDAGFLTAIPDHPELTFLPLMTKPLVAIVAPQHPLAAHNWLKLSDLENYPLIGYIPEAGLRPIIDNYLLSAFTSPPNIACSAPDERSIASLVEKNVGVSLVAKVPALNSFKIRQLEIFSPNVERVIYLAYHSSRRLTPVVRKFISFVKDSMPAES